MFVVSSLPDNITKPFDPFASNRRWYRRTILILAVALAVVGSILIGQVVASVTHDASISEEEAVGFINTVVEASLSDSPELVCLNSIFANNCLRTFAEHKADIPQARPTIACAWELVDAGGAWSVAVQVETSQGKKFTSYVIVDRDEGRLLGSNNVYWFPYQAPDNATGQANADGVVCS